MSTSNEMQTLRISSDIDEAEIKLTFANQCIKAQETLANKLKEDIQRRKEICHFKKNVNHKLEAEIRHAELEIENSRTAYKTIKMANAEIKKELLLIKENKSEIEERIRKGEKKYEDLWMQCKKKYENIPYVKKLMEDKNKAEELKNNLNALENETRCLESAIKERRRILADKNQKQIIQLAKYFVHEVPAAMKTIKEKTAMINNITKEMEDIAKEQEAIKKKASEAAAVKTVPPQDEGNTSSDNKWAIDDSPMIPKLHLASVDMDVINFKLDINKVTLHNSPIKRTVSFSEVEKNANKKTKTDESLKDNYISSYFSKTANEDEDKPGNSPTNYSKKKLINIIEDIKIDDDETYRLMTKAKIDKFQNIDVITASKKAREFIKSANALEIEEIKDSDLSNNNEPDIIVPPTQFLDLTQGYESELMQGEPEDIVYPDDGNGEASQKFTQSQDTNKKKVTFDPSLEETTIPEEIFTANNTDDGLNESEISQLNLSEVNDENCMAIKDMILKKKNQLDLSPQFVYAKNTSLMRNNDDIITSKFFETSNNEETENTAEKIQGQQNMREQNEQMNLTENITEKRNMSPAESNLESMDVSENASSPKASGTEKPVTGLLFSHGPQGIPDCLDMSMSTTGYEEGDPEFPACLDSSLLLSPKADMPMPTSGNISETGSQDLPSFLSGFRKGGLSFFKQQSSDANADPPKQNQEENFNFNFGSDEKKTRGGLFNFFR